MSFMISRETENVESLVEVESAFQAITSGGDKPYVTRDEIFQVYALQLLGQLGQNHCIGHNSLPTNDALMCHSLSTRQ